MTRKQLQDALRAYREQGLTDIKLNLSNERLYAEYIRIRSEIEVAQEYQNEAQTAEQPLVGSESIAWFERYLFEAGLKMINERWLKFVDPKLQSYSVHTALGIPGLITVIHENYGELLKIHIYGKQLLMVLSSLRQYVNDFEEGSQQQFISHKRNELEKLLNMPA